MFFDRESVRTQYRADRYDKCAGEPGRQIRQDLKDFQRAKNICTAGQFGKLWAMTLHTDNDTPELNALKALFGVPISMGRGVDL